VFEEPQVTSEYHIESICRSGVGVDALEKRVLDTMQLDKLMDYRDFTTLAALLWREGG
jgi:hypothetical protein